jgi:hypothetical protein
MITCTLPSDFKVSDLTRKYNELAALADFHLNRFEYLKGLVLKLISCTPLLKQGPLGAMPSQVRTEAIIDAVLTTLEMSEEDVSKLEAERNEFTSTIFESKTDSAVNLVKGLVRTFW